ncbi:class I SAM-dependent methyltransferase [uncultured Dysosmobacter sp.]|uniref:class I SAM-dependent methyltransferase n=1 Tax=uncultured Dysosmobacter sp. TaxID=2591384 RepID=UPI0026041829|nr:class I SAM-dependent methyltransferase [uncultured Dysosmobacter sp.]
MIVWKEVLPGVRPGKALDVGTRFGEFAVRLAEAMPVGSEVIGIDNDASAAEKAREKFAEKGLLFEQMDAAAMDYPDDTFEVVALSNTLHHIEDYGKVLAEMLRVLKPGGFFVLNEMYRDGQDAAQQVHEAQHTLEAKLDCLLGSYQRRTWKREEIIEIFRTLPLKDMTFTDFQEDAAYDAKLEAKNRKLAAEVEKIAGRPEYEALKREALEIQDRCQKDGIRRCTQLLCVGRK